MADSHNGGFTPGPDGPGAEAPPLLMLSGIGKRFGGVRALGDASLTLTAGSVHVLLGENGAGKSTLINIIAGSFGPDGGTYCLDGQPVRGLTPQRARQAGISAVFQEFSLAPNLTVEENLFLGRERHRLGVLDRRAMRLRAQAVLDDLGFDISPRQRTGDLSRAHQQMVEIAKALMDPVKVLILDEPTASLTEAETERLFALVDRLRAEGVGIIYVSHRLREIIRLADRITVLRDGCTVTSIDAAGVTEDGLVELMTGRKMEALYPQIPHAPGDALLELSGLTLANRTVEDVSLIARAGEITGIAGLVGCGKSEVIRAVYGLETVSSGSIRLKGQAYSPSGPARALTAGVCYFPSDRVAEGLALGRPIRENASMAALDRQKGVVRRGQERSFIKATMDRLRLRPANIERAVGTLSGGNRQKVMLARGLTRPTQVFLFDEPTVGIDVGAKAEVYDFLRDLVRDGAAVVLVSSDLPEVLHLSNRLYVMHRGHIAAELTGADITEAQVLACFFQEDVA